MGRGSRGRMSETEEGMPDRMEISYTEESTCQSQAFDIWQAAYRNYTLAPLVPDQRARSFSVTAQLCKWEIQEDQMYPGNLVKTEPGDKDPTIVRVVRAPKQK